MASDLIRVKILRNHWDEGRVPPQALPHATWPEQLYTEIFHAANGWSLRDYWSRLTFGLIDLQFDIEPWSVLRGHPQAELMGDRGGIIMASRREAEANGVSLATFDRIIAVVHPPPCSAGATGAPGDVVFDQGPFTLEFFQHEVGHLLGFEHAFGPSGVYDDPYCVMGWSMWHDHPILRPPEFADVFMLPSVNLWRSGRRVSAATLYRYGGPQFAESPYVVWAQPGERLTLGALSEITEPAPVLAVLPVDSGVLTIEYRTNTADDAGVDPAVVVHSIGLREVGPGHHEVDPAWFEIGFAPRPGSETIVMGRTILVERTSDSGPARLAIRV